MYGPEVNLQAEICIDVLVHIPPLEEEFIGTEVKGDARALEHETDNLDQIADQVMSETLNRLYVSTPDTPTETRIDIDPTTTQLLRQIELTRDAKIFRRLEETIERPDGRELNKATFYTQTRSRENPENWLSGPKQEGDWEQIKQDLGKYEDVSLPKSETRTRGDEWRDDILKQIGIMRLDLATGDLNIQKEMPERLLRARLPRQVREETAVGESDVVLAIWGQYIEQRTV